jgi:hypothetical protein
MVISWIQGGIGNQMFQYAAGRSLSILKQQPFFIDLQDFEGYSLHHGFELNDVFNLHAKIAEPTLLNSVLGLNNQKFLRKFLKRPLFRFVRGSQFVVEPHFHYWPEIDGLEPDCYLHGYWQSEKYFKSFESSIRSDFQFRLPLDSRNDFLSNEIQNSLSVSVHIRRGDYLSNYRTRKIMHVCDIGYYQRAIHYLSEQLKDPVFFIFSDDMMWVKGNLTVPGKMNLIEHNLGKESYRDMQLMSLCKHNIIANSSFSWWGAWLNMNPYKLVVAPRKWFVNNNNDQDLVPSKWARL